jgi:hypothetical protein
MNRILRPDDRDLLEDREPGISEDLFIDKWKGRALLDACLRAELREGRGAGEAEFNRLWTTRTRGGKGPPDPWNALEETRLREQLATVVAAEVESLRAVAAANRLTFAGSLRLGPQGAERPDPPVLNRPPFDAAPLGVNLRLGGVLPWFFHGPDGWALLVRPDRDLTAYLVHLCTVALAPLPGPLAETFQGAGRLFLRDEDGGPVTEIPLPDLDGEEARKILTHLLEDYSATLRGEGHLDDVPLEVVEKVLAAANRDPRAVNDWEDAVGDLRRKAEETGRERVSKPERARRAIDPRIPGDLEAQVGRRLLPYLRWRDARASAPAGDAQAEEAE